MRVTCANAIASTRERVAGSDDEDDDQREQRHGAAQRVREPEDLVAAIAPRACVCHRAGIVPHMSGLPAAFAHSTESAGQALLLVDVRFLVPDAAVAVAL